MKIYTKTGDTGETSLFGGRRVTKDALRIEAYGTVDELNSLLGIVRSFKPVKELDDALAQRQEELFELGADLATPLDASNVQVARIEQRHIEGLERLIDAMEKRFPPLKSFILPGGSAVGAHLHFARTVCRRAERNVVRLSKLEPVNPHTITYLNRLSDYLFVLARLANSLDQIADQPWRGNR
jgi:cob(I)alamin adenosyltransferase